MTVTRRRAGRAGGQARRAGRGERVRQAHRAGRTGHVPLNSDKYILANSLWVAMHPCLQNARAHPLTHAMFRFDLSVCTMYKEECICMRCLTRAKKDQQEENKI